MNTTSPARDPARLIPHVQIVADSEGDLHVTTPADDPPDAAPFRSFRLPRLPGSMTQWLMGLVETHWKKTGRSVAVVLLLDPVSKQWTPRVPRQVCGTDAARWSLCRDDVPKYPTGYRLVGTFQLITASSFSEIEAGVPPMDGIHLILSVNTTNGPDHRGAAAFIRVEGVAVHFDFESASTDDWASYWNSHGDQLTFE